MGSLTLNDKPDFAGNLDNIDTNSALFYKTIGSSILSLYLMDPSFDMDSLKEKINSEIKEGLVENIKILNRDYGEELVVYFKGDNIRCHYLRKRMSGCRNDVNLFVTKTPFESFANLILKSYNDPRNSGNEEFWLKLFDGRFGVPKMMSTGYFGKFRINQMEDRGRSFKDVLYNEYGWGNLEEEQKKECFEQAIGFYRQIFEFLRENKDYIEKNAPVQRKIDAEYCMERFIPFISDLKKLGNDDLAQRLDKMKGYYANIIAFNGQHWIHGDYAPRNLVCDFRKEQIISVIDFETVAIGHPVQDLVSLIHNPESDLSDEMYRDLGNTITETLCDAGIDEELIYQLKEPYRAFWDVRQARGISHEIINGGIVTEEDEKEFDWYVADLDEALTFTKQADINKFNRFTRSALKVVWL